MTKYNGMVKLQTTIINIITIQNAPGLNCKITSKGEYKFTIPKIIKVITVSRLNNIPYFKNNWFRV